LPKAETRGTTATTTADERAGELSLLYYDCSVRERERERERERKRERERVGLTGQLDAQFWPVSIGDGFQRPVLA
jgi:hypothetical protein